jgi:hypothetical protein
MISVNASTPFSLRRVTVEQDSEIHAMQTISGVLSQLDQTQVGRVLRWAAERHGVVAVPTPQVSQVQAGQLDTGRPAFEDLATLFSEASPETDSQRALVVGYWLQVMQQQKDFESQPLNTELKNLGHGVGNITDAMTGLIKRKPALVIQIQKSGTSKQARKRYKLTLAGIKAVEEMLQGLTAAV